MTSPQPVRRPGSSPGPVDASMSLIRQVVDRPLDPSYRAASDRREKAGLPRSTGTRKPLVAISAVLIGFMLVAAALVLRPSGTTASREKEALIDQIHGKQALGDEASARVDALGGEIQAYQSAALGGQTSQLSQELDRLELVTGAVGAVGPGLVLTVDDSAEAKAATGVDPRHRQGEVTGRVSSADLQVLCNGLWQAGAEAMSINGQRLTTRSAIRFAGQAILVDYRPLNPPYVVTAIGDGRDLQAKFAATASGAYLKSLSDNFQIPSTIDTSGRVDVPRSSSLQLTYAQTERSGTPSTSATPTTKATP